jgi:predicted lipid-binding transport protein (Tim44 family)
MGAFGNSAPSSGGFMRGMMGGLAGGMIGSMLFRNSGYAGGSGASGGGGMGLLEILVLCGLGFFIYRYFANRKMAAAAEAYQQTPMGALRSMEPGPFANQEVSEAQCASTLTRYDASFDLMRFKDERMDDFLKLQAAWGTRDLSGISGMIGSELQRQFEEDLAKLKANQQFNRIENIAVRSSDLIEAWQEYGKEFATVRFRANLHDYTIDENSGQVVAGDKTLAVKFEEDWTFVRAVDDARSANAWKLTAIEA